MKRIFTLLFLVFFAGSVFAQSVNLNQGSIQQKTYLQIIPYQNRNGKLIVPVIINGKTYNFLFDTGAPLTISDKLFKELNPQVIGHVEATDASGRKKETKIILLPELHLQGITFINTPGFVNHEETSDYVNLLECFDIEGIIGSNMLRNSAVQIDDQSKQIVIADNIKKLATQRTIFQKMELSPIQSNPYIMVALQKGKQRNGDKVLFDTGDSNFYTMSILGYNWFSSRVDIVNKIAESYGSFAWSLHGINEIQQHLLVNIPELNINKTIFKEVVITTTNNSRSRIGSKLLQYGIVTLDYKKKRFYFKPFDNINISELSERPRTVSPTLLNDKLVVGVIWDKALEPIINLGDEVLSINGINIQTLTVCELFNNFVNISSSEELILELKDIKNGEIKRLEIKRL